MSVRVSIQQLPIYLLLLAGPHRFIRLGPHPQALPPRASHSAAAEGSRSGRRRKKRPTSVGLVSSVGRNATREPRVAGRERRSCSMAFLVFLAAPAGARVVTSRLRHVVLALLDHVVTAGTSGTRRRLTAGVAANRAEG